MSFDQFLLTVRRVGYYYFILGTATVHVEIGPVGIGTLLERDVKGFAVILAARDKVLQRETANIFYHFFIVYVLHRFCVLHRVCVLDSVCLRDLDDSIRCSVLEPNFTGDSECESEWLLFAILSNLVLSSWLEKVCLKLCQNRRHLRSSLGSHGREVSVNDRDDQDCQGGDDSETGVVVRASLHIEVDLLPKHV